MSRITQAILICDEDDGIMMPGFDGSNIDKFNVMLSASAGLPIDRCLVHVSDRAGGTKVMSTGVYLAAFNHFSKNTIVEIFNRIDWEYPNQTMLLIEDENDDFFEKFVPDGVQD